MQTLFNDHDRKALLDRLAAMRPEAARQWGKMTPAQMLCHCAAALEVVTSDQPNKQMLIGKILAPFVRKSALGPKPFTKSSPTDPRFVISDERDFDGERTRLLGLIETFAARGPQTAGQVVHSFFGKLTGDEWGVLMHKHIDHHLRQFGQ